MLVKLAYENILIAALVSLLILILLCVVWYATVRVLAILIQAGSS